MSNSVTIRSLDFSFPGAQVLSGLDLRVEPGEFCALVGESGCGKTTLLKLVAGLLPTSGEIARPEPCRMVFQDGLVFPWLTALENLDLGRAPVRPSRGDRTEECTEVGGSAQTLNELGLAGFENKYPAQLSGGERQRLAFGMAFAGGPSAVCCDEPFGQLDVMTRERMQQWLLEYWSTHRTTILFTTHDLEEAMLLADRVCVLAQGRIVHVEPIPFSRPRRAHLRYDEGFVAMRKRLHRVIEEHRV